jgi:hypothetical protein
MGDSSGNEVPDVIVARAARRGQRLRVRDGDRTLRPLRRAHDAAAGNATVSSGSPEAARIGRRAIANARKPECNSAARRVKIPLHEAFRPHENAV